ncbi:MAG: AAA family ATPase, partial [Candidatus Latescibacteria bacterium]|nr:AAA family ATPase [Candidatus Latescibacterota bacterium]
MRDLPGFRITDILYEDECSFRCRACREADDRPVLLKVVRSTSAADRAGLKHEYEIAVDVGSPWIKQPLALENFDDALVLVAADEGEKPLRQFLDDGPLPLRQALRIGADVAAALADLHRADIVHKNVQPDSIFIDADAGVKFVDFAIASRISSDQTAIDGRLEGALPYISPEQTGRMNRALDHRTDFYSLGVTLYEMLTGRLPFSADDAVGWVHCHIAVPPLPPDQINSQVTTAVSALVLKLLDKIAEERYQSASGLKADLDECLECFERGELADFVPGRHDVGDRFQISQRLYGREREVAELLETFDRVAQGESATVLIAGCSGAGKSALVNEIHKPIVYRRGYFTAGKFDQYQRNIPYSALIQAIAALVRQVLAESSDRVALWKERLDAALGNNGEIIVDVIPDIELIIGPQPPVSNLPPAEAQNRFNMVFCEFVRAFAGPDNPLVIFLDDLQWADSASRQLIHLLTTDAATRHLLLLGAYREEDLDSAHPLALLLDEMRQDRATLKTISLRLLDPTHIGQLVADTLDAAADEVTPLADLIHRKTEGNPFFVSQLLMHLHQDGLIAFASDTASWIWDIAEIQALHLTDDLAQLMADKLREQSSVARQILQLAACIGTEFDLATLVTVAEKEPGQILADLRQPLSEGLVLPLGDAYKYTHSDAADGRHLLDSVDLCFRF